MLSLPTILASSDQLTREVFGNVPAASKAIFYALAFFALVIFGIGLYRRTRIWRLGRRGAERVPLAPALKRFVGDVLLQRRVLARGVASVAHVLLFGGFVVLLVGTTLIAVEHVLASLLGRNASDPVFHKGLYYIVYEIVLDASGLALLGGCLMLAARRLRQRPSVRHDVPDLVVLGSLFVVGLSGYLVEGLRILYEQTPQPYYSFAGNLAAWIFSAAGITQQRAASWHLLLWWLHALMALGLIAVFPYTRLLHSLAGTLNLVTGDRRPLGVMRLVPLEELEETGTVGVGRIEDFERRQLLALDACVACGWCEQACPAHESGKPLSPRAVVQDIGRLADSVSHVGAAVRPDDGISQAPLLHGETISADTVWSCTACAACIDVCPLGVRPFDLITDLRRHLVAEGQLRGPPATALQKVQRSGNPWGLPAQERLHWAAGLDVPTVKENADFDVLYWVGCAASYDARVQKVARSVVQLLRIADVNFSVLGTEERCTGDFARRMGDEFLFQQLAADNIETLDRYGVKTILTHCPHCLNSFAQDYPQLGGHYEVKHHSQFLLELLQQGRLSMSVPPTQRRPPGRPEARYTYHDPCYLARVGGVVGPPRAVLQAALEGPDGAECIEMARRGSQTSCCGAGGGRMWFDDAPAERVGGGRVQEVLATGAETVAVGCPFCLLMLADGVAAKPTDAEVRDIAEILLDAVDA